MGERTVLIDLAEMRDGGDALIRGLLADGFPVDVAFWAKAEGRADWSLYLATPAYDRGTRKAYRAVVDTLVRLGEPLGSRDSVRLLSPTEPMAAEARAAAGSRPAMTRFTGYSLGGVQLDGDAYIYPPYPPGLAARATP